MTPSTRPLTPDQESAVARATKLYLDASTRTVKPEVAQRLAEARRHVLAQMNARAAGGSVAVGGGALAQHPDFTSRLSDPTFWGAGLLVAIALAIYGGLHWDMNRKASEAAEADTEILASELPMDAYFDKGFKAWVQKEQ
jgi:hypothetical protein